jgi:hypothetical protein
MTKSDLEVLAVSFLLALSIVFTVIFNLAVLNGGTTLVKVNKYGEMIPELLLLTLVCWPVISVGLVHWHRR